MKKVVFLLFILCSTLTVNAQFYSVGSSTTSETDYFGNTVTVHKDRYGRVTGKSTTSQTDYFGNTTTTHTDAYGRVIGTSVTGQTLMNMVNQLMQELALLKDMVGMNTPNGIPMDNVPNGQSHSGMGQAQKDSQTANMTSYGERLAARAKPDMNNG